MATLDEAIYDMLTGNVLLAPLHGGRVNAIRFVQAKEFPALNFNTRGMRPLPCRVKTATREGQLEIAAMASTPLELATLTENVADALTDYQGIHKGWHLQVELSDTEFNEDIPEWDGFYKAQLFDLTATRLS